MKHLTDYPHAVRRFDTWIPMSDGGRLAARIWLPEDAEKDPVPAIFEYLPYRKNDFTSWRDNTDHTYLAGCGYAGVRVDIRGSGESDGILQDEYLQSELDDGVEVIEWLAAQPWCSGQIGMIGISWGGFNSLQIAAMRPGPLKAIITMCSTDDRYADDVHHMGGCLLADNLSWASTMFDLNACPPDPSMVGERWREMWMERLRGSGLWIEKWLAHQRRDDYWKHGSVCEDFSAIHCPVYAVSGWADGYTNSVFRLLAGLDVPRKGLVGPWAHRYPHFGVPGPAIGFMQESLRWWDQWLKGRDTGIMDEPMLRVWMQDSAPPSSYYAHREGRWIGEPNWPSPNVEKQVHRLAPGFELVADGEPVAERSLRINSPLSVGLKGGKWCSYIAPPDLPHDQRESDGGSLVFDTPWLTESVEIMGQPEVELVISADKPVAQVCVRLIDVHPNDAETRVSYGLLNLTHRDSDEEPTPLEPGRRYRVRVRLNYIAQRFPKDHAIRIAISSTYWPIAWPEPESARLMVYTGESRVLLPVRPPRPEEDGRLPAFGEPETGPPPAITDLQPTQESWKVIHDLANDHVTLEVINDEGLKRYDEAAGLEIHGRVEERYRYVANTYDSIRGETVWCRTFRRADWETRTETRTLMTSDASHFRIRATLDAFENESRVYSQTWDRKIPRDLV